MSNTPRLSRFVWGTLRFDSIRTLRLKDSQKDCRSIRLFYIDFCNDYRPYLCWQVSCILFSIIISSFDFNLSYKSLISRRKKKYITSHHASGLCLSQLDSISCSQKVDLHSLLDLICPSIISKIFSSIFIYSIVHVSWLAYHLWRNIPSGRTSWNTKEIWCERQQN